MDAEDLIRDVSIHNVRMCQMALHKHIYQSLEKGKYKFKVKIDQLTTKALTRSQIVVLLDDVKEDLEEIDIFFDIQNSRVTERDKSNRMWDRADDYEIWKIRVRHDKNLKPEDELEIREEGQKAFLALQEFYIRNPIAHALMLSSDSNSSFA